MYSLDSTIDYNTPVNHYNSAPIPTVPKLSSAFDSIKPAKLVPVVHMTEAPQPKVKKVPTS